MSTSPVPGRAAAATLHARERLRAAGFEYRPRGVPGGKRGLRE